MKIKASITIITALAAGVLSTAAQVTVDVRLDSVQFWVGQQDGLDLTVTLPAKHKLELPPIKAGDELMPDVEVVEVLKPESLRDEMKEEIKAMLDKYRNDDE